MAQIILAMILEECFFKNKTNNQIAWMRKHLGVRRKVLKDTQLKPVEIDGIKKKKCGTIES